MAKNHRRMCKEIRRILRLHEKVLHILPQYLFLPKKATWIKFFLKCRNHRIGVPPPLPNSIEYAMSTATAPSLFMNISSQPWVFAYILLLLRFSLSFSWTKSYKEFELGWSIEFKLRVNSIYLEINMIKYIRVESHHASHLYPKLTLLFILTIEYISGFLDCLSLTLIMNKPLVLN